MIYSRTVTLTFLIAIASLQNARAHSDSDIEIVSNGCQAAAHMLVAAAVYLTGGAFWAVMTNAGISPFTDDTCDKAAEPLLDYATEAYDDFDTQEFLDENCGGTVGNCDDPLLNPQPCGPFEVCPEFPQDCNFAVQCMNGMLNMDQGNYSANDIYNSMLYIENARMMGQWSHQSIGGGGTGPSFSDK